MGVSINGGTQQPWVFLLKMIILGCFGGTPIFGNTHMDSNHSIIRIPINQRVVFFSECHWGKLQRPDQRREQELELQLLRHSDPAGRDTTEGFTSPGGFLHPGKRRNMSPKKGLF